MVEWWIGEGCAWRWLKVTTHLHVRPRMLGVEGGWKGSAPHTTSQASRLRSGLATTPHLRMPDYAGYARGSAVIRLGTQLRVGDEAKAPLRQGDVEMVCHFAE